VNPTELVATILVRTPLRIALGSAEKVPAVPATSMAPAVAPAAATQERERPRSETDSAWIIPFFVVLASALAVFVWEMAQYTSLIA
jgi:hypothetical protein